MEMFCCINMNILEVILCCTVLQVVITGAKWVKGTWDLSLALCIISYNCI